MRHGLGRAAQRQLRSAGIVLVIGAACLFGLGSPANATRPNVVLIISDDAGYNDFGFMAELHGTTTDVETPNLDALALQSVVMSSGYVSGPVCSPSRAGLHTGRYQQRIGYEDNTGPNNGLPAGQQLISHQLRNLGYTTGAIGKWHLGQTDNVNRPLDMGFDEFFGFLEGGRTYWNWPDAGPGWQIRRGNTGIENQWHLQGDASRYDPVRGRHLTDAFGEEAADFIARHAGDEEPFFLYVSPHAPHVPHDAKQVDLDRFADIADPARRAIAAMNYGLDRAVGDITSALAANGIEDNTIVVYLNDNGGYFVGPFDNFPLRGHKRSTWEGGIRVPFMIKAPGLTPGTYDAPVSSLDLMSTFVVAAGGDVNALETEGTDLMPYLTGDVAGDPHELMFWRFPEGNEAKFAVRKGDWKLVRPEIATFVRLFNVADDVREVAMLNSQQPEVVEELLRELTFWEATLEKPKWGSLGAPRNLFDHFVFRNDVAAVQNWSAADAWQQAGTNTNVTFRADNAYANAILEFSTRNDADYTATNNMRRMTNETFMLNEIRLTGNFGGAVDRTATFNGEALLLVNSLAGAAPRIQLDAASTSSEASFAFRLDNELQLLDDLVLAGDGTQELVIRGNLRDYYEPRGVTKVGTSSVTLAGNNSFGGPLTINGGQMKIDGPNAAIDGASAIVIGNAGTFTLASGTVAVETIDNSAGGSFDFHGGTLRAVHMIGDLVNDGGTFAPGDSPALATIDGDFAQNTGTLAIEIGGTTAGAQFDRLLVDGAASLGGTLDVRIINGFAPAFGQRFEFLAAADGISGDFDDVVLPALLDGMQWSLLATSTGRVLIVGLPGDYNQDAVVDAADYIVWRKTFGADVMPGTGADGNRDSKVDSLDYDVWKSHIGAHVIVGAASATALPEPATAILMALSTALFAVRRPRRQFADQSRAVFGRREHLGARRSAHVCRPLI